MAETVAITAVVEKLQTLHGNLKTQHAEVEQRLANHDTQFESLGLEADGEAKHNLLKMANDIADLDIEVQRMRRELAYAKAADEGRIVAPKLPDTATPKMKALHEMRSAPEFAAAYGKFLRTEKDEFPHCEEFGVLRGKKTDHLPDHAKAGLATDFDPSAGFFVPVTMETEIDRLAIEYSGGFAARCRTVTCGGNTYRGTIRNTNRDPVKVIAEREPRTGTDTVLDRYYDRSIQVATHWSNPALTETTIEDSEIDLAAELQEDAAEGFAIDEARLFFRGDGKNGRPEGILTNQLVPEMNSGLAGAFNMDTVRRLPQEVPTIYKTNASYGLSRQALTEVMLFREDTGAGPGTGQYMWMPSSQDGNPSSLHGYSWFEAVELDGIALGAVPIIFADYNKLYRIARRRGIRTIRDELTQTPYVVFKMSKRYGARVWIEEAGVKLVLNV